MHDTTDAAQTADLTTAHGDLNGNLTWDLFCRVIDNYGDIGTCWRLARSLAARGQRVRLWADDASALAWMAPEGMAGVTVHRWEDAADPQALGRPPVNGRPGDVVIEAFACDPPAPFVEAMARRSPPPVWINLEYLSAEPWVERCHALPSPQGSGPGRGLTKWFFHPGFSGATGGLLREPGIEAEREAFDASSWRIAHGLQPNQPHERLVALFCYEQPALDTLLQALGDKPTLLALTPGYAQTQVGRLSLPPKLRTVGLPWLSQHDFDRLLWSADLNLVRGEDSLVRALWAGKPFVWQLYPQDDGAHHPKMQAFLARWMAAAGVEPHSGLGRDLQALWRRWNAMDDAPGAARSTNDPLASQPWPDLVAWTAAAQRASQAWGGLPELTSSLIAFAALARDRTA